MKQLITACVGAFIGALSALSAVVGIWGAITLIAAATVCVVTGLFLVVRAVSKAAHAPDDQPMERLIKVCRSVFPPVTPPDVMIIRRWGPPRS